jgi:phenylacetate-CoA ligase
MECISRDELQMIQSQRLRNLVWRCYENVPHYKKAFDEKGVHPADIRSAEDLRLLPFTVKSDLRDNYPYGLFAVGMEDIVRVHASSGTTGKPIVVGYTAGDLEIWSEVIARSLVCAGLHRSDIIQIAYGYGLFTGGLGLHYGAEKLGVTVVPISGGNTKRQVMLLKDFAVTALACTPSFAAYLSETMQDMGIDPNELPLRVGIFGAEPWSNNMRKDIEARLGITAIDIYGLSEIIGPGVSCECTHHCGLHIFEDHFIPEIIDPDTEETLPPGMAGELVFTTLTKSAAPVIRYRTRDISRLYTEKCACGRTSVRMERIMGRSDDMLIIRGVNVFPTQVEAALLEIGDVDPNYQLVVDRSSGKMDDLEIRVEMSDSLFNDEVRRLEDVEKKIKREVESTLGISVRVKLVEPRSIPRSEGKAKRVVDRREL